MPVRNENRGENRQRLLEIMEVMRRHEIVKGITPEKLCAIIEELGPTYAQQFSYKLFDVSVKENWENFYNELVEEGVQVDVLVNNAGILPMFKRFDLYSD